MFEPSSSIPPQAPNVNERQEKSQEGQVDQENKILGFCLTESGRSGSIRESNGLEVETHLQNRKGASYEKSHSSCQACPSVYAHRAPGGHCHHRRLDRLTVARRAKSSRGGQSNFLLQQREAACPGGSQ